MGIKGFNSLVAQYAPQAFCTVALTELAGKRIAVDANNWMYVAMFNARKRVLAKTDIAQTEPDVQEIRREWMMHTLNFVTGWIDNKITPIFVFDGPDTPEKTQTKDKRREERQKKREKIDNLYAQLRGDVLAQSSSLITDLRRALSNYNVIQPEEYELFQSIIRGIGIPCLQATGDGEQLCAMLCIEGHVAAVYSTDTDNLAYGVPLLLTGFSTNVYSYSADGNRIQHLDGVRHDRILQGLDMTHAQFVDLCVMSGCDFNTNIPGYAVKNSYKLLKLCTWIENLPPHLDKTCLRYEVCRECFRYRPSSELIKSELIKSELIKLEEPGNNDYPPGFFDIDKRAIITARDYLELVGISSEISRIVALYGNHTESSPGGLEHLNLPPAPRYIPPDPNRPMVKLNVLPIPAMTATTPIPTNTQPAPKFVQLNILPS